MNAPIPDTRSLYEKTTIEDTTKALYRKALADALEAADASLLASLENHHNHRRHQGAR